MKLYSAVLAGALAFTGLGPEACAETPDRVVDTRPNIVYIQADDLDAKLLPYMPWTQKYLGDEGVRFNNFTFSLALCCPARASILTGKYAHNTGVFDNGETPEGGYGGFYRGGHEANTFATKLDAQGYSTAYYGKYLNGYAAQAGLPQTHIPAGWDEWFAIIGNPFQQYDYTVNSNGTIVTYGPDRYFTDTLSRRSRAWMVEQTSPFMATISTTNTHAPFVPAPRHLDKYPGLTYPRNPNFDEEYVTDKPASIQDLPRLSNEDKEVVDVFFRRRVLAALSVDDLVKAVVDDLSAAGKLDNTYIVLTSDNGYHLGEHRLMGSPGYIEGPGGRGGKNSPYLEDIDVPLLMRGPGIADGTVRSQLVSNIDIGPTFTQIGGTTMDVDGESFLALAKGGNTPLRSALLLERGIGTPYSGVRTRTHTYINSDVERDELYDTNSDPWQIRNVHAGYPDLTAELRVRTATLRSCSGVTCRIGDD